MSAGLLFVPGLLALFFGLLVSLLTRDYFYALAGLSVSVAYIVGLMLYAVSDWRTK